MPTYSLDELRTAFRDYLEDVAADGESVDTDAFLGFFEYLEEAGPIVDDEGFPWVCDICGEEYFDPQDHNCNS